MADTEAVFTMRDFLLGDVFAAAASSGIRRRVRWAWPRRFVPIKRCYAGRELTKSQEELAEGEVVSV